MEILICLALVVIKWFEVVWKVWAKIYDNKILHFFEDYTAVEIFHLRGSPARGYVGGKIGKFGSKGVVNSCVIE